MALGSYYQGLRGQLLAQERAPNAGATSESERLCCRTALPRLYARASAELLWLSATGPSERLTRAQLQLAAGISSKRSEQLANRREKLCRRRCRRLADWGAHQPANASVAALPTREDPS